MAKPDYRLTLEEVLALEENFRSMTHKVSNWLTVVKALATLSYNDPIAYEKLIALKLMQCPDLVNQLRIFADDMYKRMNPLIPLAAAVTEDQTAHEKTKVG